MSSRSDVSKIIEDAARLLPAQGPIDAFVAQNTLHGFEDRPFEEAVVQAARIYAAEPFLPESRYREDLARGRIRASDIDVVLERDLGRRGTQPLAGGRTTLAQLQRTLLLHSVRQESDAAVRWTLTEGEVLGRLRSDLSPVIRSLFLACGRAAGARDDMAAEQLATSDLWHACVEATARTRPTVVHVRPPVRYRDLLLAIDPSLDTDAMVHPLLIRLVAAFLDQGVASWPMSGRDRGFLTAVAELLGFGGGPLPRWCRCLPARMRQAVATYGPNGPDETSVLDLIATELERSGIPRASWADHVMSSLVALRGWAGMVRQLELRPDRSPVRQLPVRLSEFLAVRVLLDRAAAEWAVRRLGFPVGDAESSTAGHDLGVSWSELRDRSPPRRGPGSLARAFLLHQVSQLLGLVADDIRNIEDNELIELEQEIAGFDALVRRRIFHLAYESRHATEVLDGLAAHVVTERTERPRVQAVFCIDERCESFRRYLEEEDAAVETFGTAGFFAVPMYYRGIDDWHTTPLCPIVVRPVHTVTETPLDEAVGRHRQRQWMRRSVARLLGGAESGSRTLVRGGLLTAIAGAVAAVPLVARVAFPRLTAVMAARAAERVRQRIPTRLDIHRSNEQVLPDGTRAGFDIGEMAAIVRRLLEDIGLTNGFSRIVAVVGHGSTSLNNPHESAYDCGACGGGRGGPNARAFALMANDPAVRGRLEAAGVHVPAETVFVAGMLDTCTSEIRWFDTDRVPASHAAEFAAFREQCRRAGGLDARERCRRFDSVPLDVSAAEALRSVKGRAGDLAQVRPEYGHASNAVCVIGRRELTRGLYLDRRAFLVSYDPARDVDGSILERTLAAVGPVCSGINLAYFFSRVDPIGYGAGTKLPHNITGLLGVMDGHASDLRTGLPLQGVEIHEPVRLLMVIDSPLSRVRAVLDRLPSVRRLVEHEWVRAVVRDPATGRMLAHRRDVDGAAFSPYEPESLDLPVAPDSTSWYRGRRDNVPPARIVKPLIPRASGEVDA